MNDSNGKGLNWNQRFARFLLPAFSIRLFAIAAAPNAMFASANAGTSNETRGSDVDAPARLAGLLSPAEELATFTTPSGFRVELVAAEPLIESPIQVAFDAEGRAWVVEMRGPDRALNGRISVLVDDDGDGRMDRASVFADRLDTPRALALTRTGALVLSAHDLVFLEDKDHDLRAEMTTVVDSGLPAPANPRHGPNGLLPTLDNSFQCAASDVRYRFVLGQWTKERTCGGGQWGITKDDLGRVYMSTDHELLRADFVTSSYLARNPNIGAGPLVNATCELVPPAANVSAACGPLVYRGAGFPDEFRGAVFVCESDRHQVDCLRFEERPPFERSIRPALADRAFLTSKDENFAPVNLADGPDGALYVVDMHGAALERTPTPSADGTPPAIGRGRIWRIVRTQTSKGTSKPLARMSGTELVNALSSPHGWTRDTAQRLLVEGTVEESQFLPALTELANSKQSKLGRIHALWTLAGLRRIDAATCQKALESLDSDVRIAGLRVSEILLLHDAGPPIQFLLGCAAQPDPRLQQQAFASLSGTIDIGILAGLILRDASSAENRRAAQSGVGANQLIILNATLLSLNTPDHFAWDEAQGRAELVRELTAAVVREARALDIGTVLEQFVTRPTQKPWTRIALIDGALEGRGVGPLGDPARIRLAARPAALLALLDGSDVELASKVAELVDALAWPGRDDVPAEPAVRPLAPDEARAFDAGRATYSAVCVDCHRANGRGDPGLAPSLSGSRFVLDHPTIAARIVLGGLASAVQASDRAFGSSMPPLKASDVEVAGLLTYLRRSFGNGAEPVAIAEVARARADVARHSGPYSRSEFVKPIDTSKAGDAR